MTPFVPPEDPAVTSRDRALRAGRRVARSSAVGALGLAGVFSLVAARTVKGHSISHATTATPRTTTRASIAVQVPAPQSIPDVSGLPKAPRPPAQAPSTSSAAPSSSPASAAPAPSSAAPAPSSAPAPAPAPAPTTSGGS